MKVPDPVQVPTLSCAIPPVSRRPLTFRRTSTAEPDRVADATNRPSGAMRADRNCANPARVVS